MSEDAGPRTAVDLAEEDRTLLGRLRDGDDSAFAALFSRHAQWVRRFALRLVPDPAAADDVVAESFFRVLQALRRGAGPTDHLPTYLVTVARRVAWEWQGRQRDVPVTDEELRRRVEPYADNFTRRTERSLITRAFATLPRRWQSVLWWVEVVGERPAVVAPQFGLTPNATAALVRRAREGLRAAYLQAHVDEHRGSRYCRPVVERLGAYTAGSVKGAEVRRIRDHLDTCPSCAAQQLELRQVFTELRSWAGGLAVPAAMLPMGHQLALAAAGVHPAAGASAAVLGAGAAGGTAGSAGAAVGKGLFLLTRLKLAITTMSVAAVGIAGVAAGPVLSGGLAADAPHPPDGRQRCMPHIADAVPAPRPAPRAPAAAPAPAVGDHDDLVGPAGVVDLPAVERSPGHVVAGLPEQVGGHGPDQTRVPGPVNAGGSRSPVPDRRSGDATPGRPGQARGAAPATESAPGPGATPLSSAPSTAPSAPPAAHARSDRIPRPGGGPLADLRQPDPIVWPAEPKA